MAVNNISLKMGLAFLLLALTLTIVTPGWADVTSDREKSKSSTTTTQGDFSSTPRCAANQVACGRTCVNVLTDSNNCGVCGTVCARGQKCTAGICAASSTTGTMKNLQSIFK